MRILILTALLGLIVGCSLSYKPEVKDSEIYHQSGNRPKADVNLDLRK